MRYKTLCLVSLLLTVGCAQNQRAGDITLATPVTASGSEFSAGESAKNISATPRSTKTGGSNGARSGQISDASVTGTGLSTGYGGVVNMGDAVEKTSGATSRANEVASVPYTASATASASASSIPVADSPTAATRSVETEVNTANVGSTPRNSSEASIPSTPNGSSSTYANQSKIPARVISITRVKPDCKGSECPVIKVKRLSFSGHERFNAFLDQTLASMAEIDASNIAPFKSLAEFAAYFWKVAKPRDEVSLEASIKRGDADLVVVELDSYIFKGGAHGVSTSQYINWLPVTDKILSLETMLLPKMMPAFVQVLKKQHAICLQGNDLAMKDLTAYNKLWPFVATDNAALLTDGLAITYDPYTIAPGSFGHPTLLIPYSELKGILRPEVLPKE